MNKQQLKSDVLTMSQNLEDFKTAVREIKLEHFKTTLVQTKLEDLRSIDFSEKVPENTEYGSMSSNEESYPWFLNENNELIDFTQSMRLFDGVKLVSKYLDTRLKMDEKLISDVQISEILKPFEQDKDISVLDFYNYLDNLYRNGNLPYKSLNNDLANINSIETELNPLNNRDKPLGSLGDMTINEAAIKLKELNWDFILNNTKVTINALPAAANLISYSLILRGYMKYIHNRPYAKGLNHLQRETMNKLRNRQLAGFVILGAPFISIWLKTITMSTRDIFNVEVLNPSHRAENTTLSYSFMGGLFMKGWIPDWLKLALRILVLMILVVKLLGFSILDDFYLNTYYLKSLGYSICTLIILYNILNLYLLHIFSKRELDISEVLPDFIIKWLEDFKIMAKTPEGKKELKNIFYVDIIVYLIVIIVIFNIP